MTDNKENNTNMFDYWASIRKKKIYANGYMCVADIEMFIVQTKEETEPYSKAKLGIKKLLKLNDYKLDYFSEIGDCSTSTAENESISNFINNLKDIDVPKNTTIQVNVQDANDNVICGLISYPDMTSVDYPPALASNNVIVGVTIATISAIGIGIGMFINKQLNK